jgi:equilibrative nucleoside transporter 1/2/3
VYAIVVLQGLASAVPWNVFVTESEYFGLRVHVPPSSRVLADNFENVNLVISQAAYAPAISTITRLFATRSRRRMPM